MKERVRPVDGCSPDAWCAQSGVFVWWTRAFYAARGHAPRVSFVRPAVCSPAAARVVVFMRSCCLSCASLTVLKRYLKRSVSRQVRFPPPPTSRYAKWSLSRLSPWRPPCTMVFEQTRCGWCVARDGTVQVEVHHLVHHGPCEACARPDAPSIWSRNQPSCGGSCSHTRAVHVTVRKHQLSRLSC
jgi:hypothetical protein